MPANSSYAATEYTAATMEPTGKVETYFAGSLEAAVDCVLYTRRLSNGNAYKGPTNRCVYSGPLCYAIVPNKPARSQR